MPDPDLREQIEAIQKGLRRVGREMVLSSSQALVRGLFVLVACGLSLLLLNRPWWQMGLLWSVAALLAAAVEALLYLRLVAKCPGKFITGVEWQLLKCEGLLIVVGAVLSTVLVLRGQGDLLPGLWMLLVGMGYVVTGLFSFSDTWILGLCSCVGGAIALFLAPFYSLSIVALVLGAGSIAWSLVLKAREQRDGQDASV
jgi:hypothetical protein